MRQFKEEYRNCVVTVNSPSIGRVSINTATANPNEWAAVKEFEFMLESVEAVKTDYSAMTFTQLKELFPDIEAKSKKEYLEKLA